MSRRNDAGGSRVKCFVCHRFTDYQVVQKSFGGFCPQIAQMHADYEVLVDFSSFPMAIGISGKQSENQLTRP
jgi:hypothetical protein